MNKKTALLILVLMLVAVVNAQEGKVVVVNFHYKDGSVTLKDRTVKLGYHPDRNFQSEKGHMVEVISVTGEPLYSFRSKLPLEVFTDYTAGSELKGGIIRLSETDFSLIVPYFEEAQEINFYNERNYKIATFDISRELFAPRKLLIPLYIILAAAIIGLVIHLIKRRYYR